MSTNLFDREKKGRRTMKILLKINPLMGYVETPKLPQLINPNSKHQLRSLW